MIAERAAGFPAARETAEISRRGLLVGAAAFGVSATCSARAQSPDLRVAAIDWAMLETALLIGARPVAACELELYRTGAVEPPLPDSVQDLGLRGAISYETLLAARPDLILSSPWYANREHVLKRIAPVESASIYEAGRKPYEPAEAVTLALGPRLGRAEAAEAAIADARATLARHRETVAPFRDHPFLIVNLGDPKHFRVFGADSMFVDVLERLGLASAWSRPTSFGAYATVGLEALAELPDAYLVNVGPTPPDALTALATSPLWRAAPQVAAGRLLSLPPVNPYGALPAAKRFARLLTEGLAARADG